MKKKVTRKMKRFPVFMAAWMVLLALTLLSCAKKESTVSENGLFKLRCVTQTTASETIIADQLGFFADEGIEIVYVGSLGQGVTQFQAIAQGDIDVFTQGHITSVVQARLAGLMVVNVAPGFVDDAENHHVTYLVREDDRTLKTLDDLPGHKVGISGPGVCIDGFIRVYLEDRGLDYSTVQYITMPQTGQPEQAVLQGLIDVTTSHSPFGGVALARGGVRELGSSWDIFHSPSAGLATRGFSEDFIAKHPDIVQSWSNAMYRARVFSKTNPEYAKKACADYLGLDPADISVNVYDQHKNYEPEYVQQWFDLSERLGYWKKGESLPEDAYTNAFIPKDVPATDADIGKQGI
ncbi:ABC transporter substrate-binding protein [Treponema endosymbiont of Eucomonympha sp.]|uniref:ABC transporter substrate-binding protein n=1 Tax=Treponema endosymbiont of Eucomonympha sp. TaxID=1580831 RepID=UPI000783DBBD|nr:ABC transporter substrate-binding protein [Treponema endosymbiont of Eucomonympha sp.]